jgi:predicted transcriptional regulator
MSTSAQSKASRLVTVRLEPATRDRLDVLASTSDRTLAQLIRYALTAYFDGASVSPTVRETDESNSSRHTSVRIPAALVQKVEDLAKASRVTSSDVIRTAIGIWLKATSPEVLGAPAVESTVEPSVESGEVSA